jgi:hypothetical protein
MITQSELKEVLDYNPDTGVFSWIKQNGNVAGTKANGEYVRIQIKRKQYLAHRLAHLYMTGNFPKNDIDHINHIKDDNRWVNLRDATDSQNHANVKRHKKNTSGYKGVSWNKTNKKWRAKIEYMKKSMHLGYYTTPQEASEAYKKKAIELFGEFSYTE